MERLSDGLKSVTLVEDEIGDQTCLMNNYKSVIRNSRSQNKEDKRRQKDDDEKCDTLEPRHRSKSKDTNDEVPRCPLCPLLSKHQHVTQFDPKIGIHSRIVFLDHTKDSCDKSLEKTSLIQEIHFSDEADSGLSLSNESEADVPAQFQEMAAKKTKVVSYDHDDTKDQLASHDLSKQNSTSGSIQCRFCSQHFANGLEWFRDHHEQFLHNNGNGFTCDQCGVHLTTKSEMCIHNENFHCSSNHLSDLSRDEPLRFDNRNNKKRSNNKNNQSEADLKPFSCEHCPKSFGSYQKLERHQKKKCQFSEVDDSLITDLNLLNWIINECEEKEVRSTKPTTSSNSSMSLQKSSITIENTEEISDSVIVLTDDYEADLNMRWDAEEDSCSSINSDSFESPKSAVNIEDIEEISDDEIEFTDNEDLRMNCEVVAEEARYTKNSFSTNSNSSKSSKSVVNIENTEEISDDEIEFTVDGDLRMDCEGEETSHTRSSLTNSNSFKNSKFSVNIESTEEISDDEIEFTVDEDLRKSCEVEEEGVSYAKKSLTNSDSSKSSKSVVNITNTEEISDDEIEFSVDEDLRMNCGVEEASYTLTNFNTSKSLKSVMTIENTEEISDDEIEFSVDEDLMMNCEVEKEEEASYAKSSLTNSDSSKSPKLVVNIDNTEELSEGELELTDEDQDLRIQCEEEETREPNHSESSIFGLLSPISNRSLSIIENDDEKEEKTNGVNEDQAPSYNNNWMEYNPNSIPCPNCGLTFSEMSQMWIHFSEETNQNECPLCSKVFAERSQLEKHIRTHFGQQEPNSSSMDLNVEIIELSDDDEEEEEQETNMDDGVMFVEKFDNKSTEKSNLSQRFTCPHCPIYSTPQKRLFEKHLVRQHNNGHGFCCSLCPSANLFMERSEFLDHNPAHIEQLYTHHCPFCSEVFISPKYVDSEARPVIECSRCKRFYDANQINNKTPLGELTVQYPYPCPRCPMGYFKDAQLKRHLKKCQFKALQKSPQAQQYYHKLGLWNSH